MDICNNESNIQTTTCTITQAQKTVQEKSFYLFIFHYQVYTILSLKYHFRISQQQMIIQRPFFNIKSINFSFQIVISGFIIKQ